MQDLQRHLSLIGKKDYVFVVIQIALGQLVCDLPSGEIEIRYIGIDDPGRRFAKLRGFIRIYTESPLQTQWRRVKPGDAKTLSYILINWPFSHVTGVRYFHMRLWKIALLF